MVLTGAIIGGLVGALAVIIIFFLKNQRYKKVMEGVSGSVDYSGLYHYANQNRYKNSMKFYDSYGVLYVQGNKAYYKTSNIVSPMVFNLDECKVQQEPNWRKLKWFSITTPNGEKHYFDSHKMGAFVNNSDETLKGLEVLKSKARG